MQKQKSRALLVIGALGVTTVAGVGLNAWAGDKDNDVKIALPAAQVIASIQTAVAAQPGSVLEIEAERENGKDLCEVVVLAADGKTYEVEVDVATNKVIEVEVEDADDAEDKD